MRKADYLYACNVLVQKSFVLMFTKFSIRFYPFVWPLSVSQSLKIYVVLTLFSAPEPKAQVHYCDHTLSVVRRPSVRRPSVVNFHIFDFSSETAQQNSTKLDRKQDLNVLYQVCVFRADRKNKMAARALIG